MAYSDNFPAVRPVFQSDFANGGRIDPRISYSRSTTGTYFGTDKHESSQNLLLQSNTFNTTWASNDVTRTSTASAGPDSSSAAFLVYPNTNSSNARVYQSLTVSSGERGVLSVYAKQTGKTILAIVEQIGTGSLEYSYFDLTDGSDSGSSNHTRIATASGNGYYRCSIALTPNASRTSNVYFYVVDAAGSVTATANGTDGIYLFGAQYETLASGGPTVYNATTTQIHRAYAPTLQTAAINAPRFEHSATDSASMGLLVEGSSQNLLSYSEDFTNAAWDKVVATGYQAPSISDSVAIGPDGLLSASSCTASTTTAYQEIRHAATVGSGAVAFSVYAKAVGASKRLLLREDATSGASAAFDLLTGTVVGTNSGGVGSIEPVGNGYYRCTMVCTPGSGSQLFAIWMIENSATTFGNVTGDGYSGFLLFGAQVENQSFASSYIKSNSGSATTRAADSASMPIASTGYSGNNGTMLVEVDGGYGSYPSAVSLHDGAGYERVLVSRDSLTADDSTDFYAFVGDKSGTSSTLNLSGSGSASKVAVSFATNDFAATAGGGTVVTSTSGVSPAAYLTTLQIGNQIASNPWNGHIKRIAIYSEALSDTNLQALTS